MKLTSVTLTVFLLLFTSLSGCIGFESEYVEISEDQDTDTDQPVLIPWISIREFFLQDWNEPIDGTLNDGDSMSYSFFEEVNGDVIGHSNYTLLRLHSWQEFEIDIVCDDGGNGETGAPNAQEETDTLHWTIRANNGQELAGSFDCDGDTTPLVMANEGNEDFENWFVGLGPRGLIFHDIDDADSHLESAPLIEDMFPISVEFTAETRGHTLDQNQDIELEFNSEPIRFDNHVSRFSRSLYCYTFMATEDSYLHRHYNNSS